MCFIYYKLTIGFNPKSEIYVTMMSRGYEKNNGVWLEEESWVTVSRSSRSHDNSSSCKKRMKMRFRKWINLVCLS